MSISNNSIRDLALLVEYFNFIILNFSAILTIISPRIRM